MTFEQLLIFTGFSVFVGVGSGVVFWLLSKKLLKNPKKQGDNQRAERAGCEVQPK